MIDPSTAWTGDFGRRYTERNTLSADELDALYVSRYGTSRDELNREFLGGIAPQSILEVGCNVGQQLRHLRRVSQARPAGIDLQEEAVRIAREALPEADIRRAAATSIPHPDGAFDLVFTSGVLIHIPPSDLGAVMDEMHRVARRWIWGLEYWSETPVEVPFRGHGGLLWKRDFRRAWQERFPSLRTAQERLLPYRDGSGLVDSMYLLEKSG